MKRTVWLGAAMAAALVRPAMADDLTISSKTTSAIATSAAANSSPGNITINSGGSVETTNAITAVTLDSNKSILNNGLILSTSGNTTSAVNILGGNTGSFTNNGNISVVATGTVASGSSGVLLNGTGAFTGDFVLGNASSITVSQPNAHGLFFTSDLLGNLTNRGTILATGQGANGILATSNIGGAFVNRGNISVATSGTSTAVLNINPGAVVSLGGSVGGGILNAGPVNSSDTTQAASIYQPGINQALLVAPSVGGNAANLNIGVVNDSANPGFSIINRGRISSVGTQPRIDTTAMQIGNSAAGGTASTALAGGIYNSGSITAVATSDNTNATALLPAATNALALTIGTSTSVPTIANAAGGTISATTSGAAGGTATALQILSGSTVPSLSNAGTISASANSTNTAVLLLPAVAVTDASGTLLNITNTGTISATATVLTTNAQSVTAISLASSAQAETITNSGTIVGDIVFGTSLNNQLTIDGAHASASGQVRTTSTGRVSIAVSPSGTGGSLTTSGAISAQTLTVGPNGVLDLGIGATNGISAKGAASFDATSHLTVTPLSLLPRDAAITLVHSDASLTFGNFGATTSGIRIPFLFTGNLSVDAKNLILNLHRKTANELGLAGDAAKIYEPAMTAAATQSELGAAFSGLSSSASVQTALEGMLPIVNNAARTVALRATDSSVGTTAARQQSLLLDPDVEGGVSPWASIAYDRYNDTSTAGYDGHGRSLAVGVDYSTKNKGHIGIALSVYNADLDETGARTVSQTSQWVLFQPYMGLRNERFFFNAQMDIGLGRLHTQRDVLVGSTTHLSKGGESQWLASGGLTSGYIVNAGRIRFVPEVNLNAFHMVQSNYTEREGGTGIDLTIKERSQTSMRALVGAAVNADFDAFGGHLVPHAFGGWSQELIAPNNTIDASFTGVGGTDFSVTGPGESRSKLLASGGISYIRGRWSGGIAYDAAIQSKTRVQGARVFVAGRF